jgi:serine/threonine protein kinase
MSELSADSAQLRASGFHQTQIGLAIAAAQPFQGRYQILKVLGRGSFGITFLAKDISLPGEPACVVKLLAPVAYDADFLPAIQERFEQEARVLAKLGGHPQIPLLLNYFEIESEFYLVQEYILGETLGDLVASRGPFSEAEVRQFLADILPTLGYLHHNQVIHRDIKPDNLIQCYRDRRLVMIDFGAVKELLGKRDAPAIQLPQTYVVGTQGFIPPEQIQKQAVFASDFFALGMTCLYLLTGKYPWDLESELSHPASTWFKIFKVSAALAEILKRMTAVSLQDRYRSVQEILADLNALEPRSLLPGANLKSSAPTKLVTPESASYLSPAVRLAISIRDWKARSQQRKPRIKKTET